MANRDETDVDGVRLTHPDKVLYREQQLSKADLVEYWRRVARLALPHLEGRPLTIVRCPRGREGKCFVQRHPGDGAPEQLRVFELREKEGRGRYLAVEDWPGLVALVQIGALELHVMGCRRDRPDRPDRLVFDLDPGPGIGPAALTAAAVEVRDALEDAGLRSWPLATGGKGLHVVAPLERRHDQDVVHGFAAAVAKRMAEDEARYVASSSKAARKGRIFVDYLRNSRGATAICPYSPRARRGAPIAAPLSWDEVEGARELPRFGVADLPEGRLEHGGWKGYHDLRQRIPAAALRDLGVGS